jgi:diguanylate cyclase (GGDEF)-like protein/PAS domain S-box-containing protein
MGTWRLVNAADLGEPLAVGHDPLLLATSIFIAILAASVLVPSTERFRASTSRKSERLWLITGATAVAFGAWGMHFCAILGLKLPAPISFDPLLTALSVLPAIAGMLATIAVTKAPIQGQHRVHLAAVAMGLGFTSMHYISMEALVAPFIIRYDIGLFFLSLAGSVALLWAALFGSITLILRTRNHWGARIAGGLALGLAIRATHFVSSGAISFYPDYTFYAPINEIDARAISLGIIAVVSVLVGLLLLAIFIDRRIARINRSLIDSESRFKTLAETSACAIFTFTDKLIYVNPALSEITGYAEHELEGMSVEALFGRRLTEHLDQASTQDLSHGANLKQEVKIRCKDGSTRCLYLAIGQMKGTRISQYVGSAFDISTRKEMEKKLRHLAFYDYLTELPNRFYFLETLQDCLDKRDENTSCALLTLNLGRLKWINNNFGQDAGDELLRDISHGLAKLIRPEDILARVGGHEFAVLVQEKGAQQGNAQGENASHKANELAKSIIDMFSRPHQVSGQEVHLRCQVGITYPTDATVEAKDLLREAYIAMNDARRHSANTACLYDKAMRESAQSRLHLESDLHRALTEKQFELYYQPIVSLPTGDEIHGFEALIRWPRPDGTFIPPMEFIPIAEETGLIAPLGDWILETACRQLQAWNQQFKEDVYISVNISSLQLFQPQFAQNVAALVSKYDIVPGQLKLELTESVMVEDGPSVLLTMRDLLATGCEIMIDDFGTGYSSLSYLSRFPASILKIDQSFIQSIGADDVGAPIVKAIVSMARDLELGVVAEGIENEHAARLLKKIGCEKAQGYLFSRPIPADQATQMLTVSRT